MAHATAEVQGGEIVGISQGTDKADTNLGSATSQDAAALREELVKGEKVVVILGEGKGAVAQASLIGISSRVRDQFLFLISGIVLLTLLVNATTIKGLVNALGLTELPAVKKLMFSNASLGLVCLVPLRLLNLIII